LREEGKLKTESPKYPWFGMLFSSSTILPSAPKAGTIWLPLSYEQQISYSYLICIQSLRWQHQMSLFISSWPAENLFVFDRSKHRPFL